MLLPVINTFVIFLIVQIHLFSQQIQVHTYGGDRDEVGHDIVVDRNGTLVLLTSDRTMTKGSEDLCLLRLDAARNITQQKCFGTTKQDYPYSLVVTGDGGFVVGGTSWKSRRDAYVLKLNANFDAAWETSYDGGAWHHDEGFVVIETHDGGYLQSGMTRSSQGITRGSLLLRKLNAAGVEEWVVHEAVTTKNYLFDVIQDSDGDFVSAGVESGHHRYTEFEFYTPSAAGVVLKHDSKGNELWRMVIDREQNDWFTKVVESPVGGYYLLGSTQSAGAGSFDVYLVKVDRNGEIEWERTYGDLQFDYGRDVEILDNGDLLILGTTCLDVENFTTDILLIRLNSQGEILWQEVFGGQGSEDAHAMTVVDDYVHVAGEIHDEKTGDKDVLLLDISLKGTVNVVGGDRDSDLVLVYPNPVDNSVTFDLSKIPCRDYNLSVFNQQGKRIGSYNQHDNFRLMVETASWTRSNYFYTITSVCHGVLAGKIMK